MTAKYKNDFIIIIIIFQTILYAVKLNWVLLFVQFFSDAGFFWTVATIIFPLRFII